MLPSFLSDGRSRGFDRIRSRRHTGRTRPLPRLPARGTLRSTPSASSSTWWLTSYANQRGPGDTRRNSDNSCEALLIAYFPITFLGNIKVRSVFLSSEPHILSISLLRLSLGSSSLSRKISAHKSSMYLFRMSSVGSPPFSKYLHSPSMMRSRYSMNLSFSFANSNTWSKRFPVLTSSHCSGSYSAIVRKVGKSAFFENEIDQSPSLSKAVSM